MPRLFLGVLAGFLVSVLGILGGEQLIVRVIHPVDGILTADMEQKFIAFGVLNWVLCGLLGGLAAGLIGRGRELATGGALAALHLLWQALSAPVVREKQPEWYLILSVVTAVGTALIGAALVWRQRRRTMRHDAASEVAEPRAA